MKTLTRCAALCLISLVVLPGCKKSDVNTPLVNQPPVANAGPDQTLIFPIDSTQLVGSGTDPDGIIISYKWEHSMENPGPHTLVTPTQPVTKLTDLERGQYRFSLKVTDNHGLSAKDEVVVSVEDSTSNPWNY